MTAGGTLRRIRKQMSEDFCGKTVIVTGAARGIGAATARAFFEQGANVALCDIDGERVGTLAAELGENSKENWAYHERVDARDEAAVKSFVDNVSERGNGVDILVNNIGVVSRISVADTSLAEWERLMTTNTTSAFVFSKFVVPRLREDSSVLMVESIASHVGTSCYAAYSASKAAVLALARCLALELAPRTRVNCIAPADIDTEMAKQVAAEEPGGDVIDNPMGRMGRPEEVAYLLAFLASSKAGFITGQTIHINGGQYLG